MSLTAIRSTLAGHAGLTMLVGARIATDKASQATPRPFVIIEQSGTEYLHSLDGSIMDVLSEEFQVACFADNRDGAEAVADQVVLALAGQRVIGRQTDFVPEFDVHTTAISVTWMD
jgi:hypothetical protein